MQEVWTAVDHYFSELLVPADPDDLLNAALAANKDGGLPAIDVSRLQGKLLELLVRLSGARRVLEIGTLGGYSTIWMARALPAGGCVVSLELDPHHAEVARANLLNAGALDRVDLRVGPAIETLEVIEKNDPTPFDLIFIDADKRGYPEYLDWSLRLSRPGTVIVADNVVRDGRVLDAETEDADVQGVRRFTEQVAAEPRLSATVLQNVGIKGYDGLAIAVVVA